MTPATAAKEDDSSEYLLPPSSNKYYGSTTANNDADTDGGDNITYAFLLSNNRNFRYYWLSFVVNRMVCCDNDGTTRVHNILRNVASNAHSVSAIIYYLL